MNRLESSWYRRSPWLIVLIPASLLYCGLSRLRRLLYRTGLLARHRLPVPVPPAVRFPTITTGTGSLYLASNPVR